MKEDSFYQRTKNIILDRLGQRIMRTAAGTAITNAAQEALDNYV